MRNHHLTEDLVVLDGLTGTGKTMLAPIIGSFERVEVGRFIYDIEYICVSQALGAHRSDSAQHILDLIIDWKLYDNFISREVNFRPGDLSTVLSSHRWPEYLARLFRSDGEQVELDLATKKPIMFIITHQLKTAMQPLIKQFQGRIKIVEMVRHPYYLLEHWMTPMELHGNSARDFTSWVADNNGRGVPWFANDWKDEYWNLSKFDRAVFSIDSLTNPQSTKYKPPVEVKTIPFEDFVLNTNNYLNSIASWLGTKTSSNSEKAAKKQNLPRSNINAGINKSIYQRYNYRHSDRLLTHQESYQNKEQYAKDNMSKLSAPTLQKLVDNYESKFGLWF